MTERWNHSQKEEITSKMQELTGCMCVVTFKPEGDRRGIIERIETLNLAKDFPESFERSQFKVQLTSGEIVVVSGSAISEIESTTAGSHSAPARRKPRIKARRVRTKKSPGQKRKSIATKAAKAAAKVMTRRTKPRKNKNVGR